MHGNEDSLASDYYGTIIAASKEVAAYRGTGRKATDSAAHMVGCAKGAVPSTPKSGLLQGVPQRTTRKSGRICEACRIPDARVFGSLSTCATCATTASTKADIVHEISAISAEVICPIPRVNRVGAQYPGVASDRLNPDRPLAQLTNLRNGSDRSRISAAPGPTLA